MQGLLPDHVLAPRAYRTGITSSYSDRQMRAVVAIRLQGARLRAAGRRRRAPGGLAHRC